MAGHCSQTCHWQIRHPHQQPPPKNGTPQILSPIRSLIYWQQSRTYIAHINISAASAETIMHEDPSKPAHAGESSASNSARIPLRSTAEDRCQPTVGQLHPPSRTTTAATMNLLPCSPTDDVPAMGVHLSEISTRTDAHAYYGCANVPDNSLSLSLFLFVSVLVSWICGSTYFQASI